MERIVMERSLERLIEPLSRTEFFSQYWGERCLVSRPKQLDSLFSWQALSDILSTHRFEFPRLRLVRSGKIIPATEYMQRQADRRGNMFTTHDSGAVMNLLSAGAGASYCINR
jgi:hypothetical protein